MKKYMVIAQKKNASWGQVRSCSALLQVLVIFASVAGLFGTFDVLIE